MIQSLTPAQAQELIAAGGLDVVDVREPSEWAQGHLLGSRLVPLGRLRSDVQGLLKQDGILFVCAAGVRSQTAAMLAEAAGRKNLYNLVGGTRAWQSAGLPLVRDDEVAAAPAAAIDPRR